MEEKVESVNQPNIISNNDINNSKALVISIPTPNIIDHHPRTQATTTPKKGKKNFFKVALFMMRGRSSKKTKVDESGNIWRKFVGSMRPMHLPSDDKSPQQQIEFENTNNNNDDAFDSQLEFPNSPTFPDSPFSPSPASSQYASAVGLSEMVVEEEEEEDNNSMHEKEKKKEEEIKKSDNEGESDGDDMIDAKADEFIAQFYQQMRLQHMDIVDRHYNEISMRSLGLG